MKKRMLSIFLSAIMVVSLLPVTALAAGTTHEVGSEAELLTAFENAQDGDTILMTDDIELDVSGLDKTKCELIEASKKVTLDGGGHTLSTSERALDYSQWDDAFWDDTEWTMYSPVIFGVAASGGLTFRNLTFRDRLTLEGEMGSTLVSGDSAELSFLSGDYEAGCIALAADSQVSISGGTFRTSGYYGYSAFAIFGGSAEITGGAFTGPGSILEIGCGSRTVITGGTFVSAQDSPISLNNSAISDEGNDIELTITGGFFKGCGSAIRLYDSAYPAEYDDATGKYSGETVFYDISLDLSGGVFLVDADEYEGVSDFINAWYCYNYCPDPTDFDGYMEHELVSREGVAAWETYAVVHDKCGTYPYHEPGRDGAFYMIYAEDTGKYPVLFYDQEGESIVSFDYVDEGTVLSAVDGYDFLDTITPAANEELFGWRNLGNGALMDGSDPVTAPLCLQIDLFTDVVHVHSTAELRQALEDAWTNDKTEVVIYLDDPINPNGTTEADSYYVYVDISGARIYPIELGFPGGVTILGNGKTLTRTPIAGEYLHSMMWVYDGNTYIYDLTLDGNGTQSSYPAISFKGYYGTEANLYLNNVTVKDCVNTGDELPHFGGAVGAMHVSWGSDTSGIWRPDLWIGSHEKYASAYLSAVGCSFHDNKAQIGGAIYMDTYSSFDLVNTEIYDNEALYAGGGIYCNQPYVYFDENLNYYEATNNLTSVKIHDNEALMGGGMLYGGEELQTHDTEIYSNSAVEGGGLWAANSASPRPLLLLGGGGAKPHENYFRLHDYSGIKFYGNTASSDPGSAEALWFAGTGEGDDVFYAFPEYYRSGFLELGWAIDWDDPDVGDYLSDYLGLAPNYQYNETQESMESGKLGVANATVPFTAANGSPEAIPDDVMIPFLSWYEDFETPDRDPAEDGGILYDSTYDIYRIPRSLLTAYNVATPLSTQAYFNYPFGGGAAPARFSGQASGKSISSADGSPNAFMLGEEAYSLNDYYYAEDTGRLSSYGMKAVYFGHLVKYVDGDEQVYDKQAYADGATVTVKSVGDVGFSRRNAEFIGWNTEPDGSGETLSRSFTITGNTILYAQWEDAGGGGGGGGGGSAEYTLRFESNGGTEYEEKSYPAGTVVELDKIPAKAGFTFTGWYTDNACTKLVTEVTMNKNITVYAGWEQTAIPSLFGIDHYAYIIGFEDGTVRPEASITRAEVVTIFFRLLSDDVRDANLTTANTFSDVNGETWYRTAASTLAAMGIVNGCDDGKFHGEYNITRAEFAAIAARFDKLGNTTPASFSDIYGHWAEKEIAIAANNGWILGYVDGTFRPDQSITRAEAIAMINRVLQRMPEKRNDLLDGMVKFVDNADTKWYYIDVQEATNSHDYERRDNGYEHWTALKDNRDWKAFE